jgi:hypothetical protein
MTIALRAGKRLRAFRSKELGALLSWGQAGSAGAAPKALLPCKTCPWRVDADVAAIPGFDSQKAVGLLRTASLGEGAAVRPIMARNHYK